MHGVIVHDASYFQTLELKGTLEHLTTVLSMFCDPASVAPYSKRYIGGLRECPVDLYESQAYPAGFIGPATVLWDTPIATGADTAPKSDSQPVRQLLLRFHPSILGAVANTVEKSIAGAHAREARNMAGSHVGSSSASLNTTCSTFRTFCSFDIIGPMATDTIKACLRPVTATPKQKMMVWTGLGPPAAVPSGTILSLDVQDPRLQYVHFNLAALQLLTAGSA